MFHWPICGRILFSLPVSWYFNYEERSKVYYYQLNTKREQQQYFFFDKFNNGKNHPRSRKNPSLNWRKLVVYADTKLLCIRITIIIILMDRLSFKTRSTPIHELFISQLTKTYAVTTLQIVDVSRVWHASVYNTNSL